MNKDNNQHSTLTSTESNNTVTHQQSSQLPTSPAPPPPSPATRIRHKPLKFGFSASVDEQNDNSKIDNIEYIELEFMEPEEGTPAAEALAANAAIKVSKLSRGLHKVRGMKRPKMKSLNLVKKLNKTTKKKRLKKHFSKNFKGKVIDGVHELYTLTAGMTLGIRYTVGKAASMSRDDGLLLNDFTYVEKVTFPPNGCNQLPHITPAHKLAHTFKFKTYSPKVFHRLRDFFDIDAPSYMASVCGDYNFIEFISNSKSGQFFFYSHDGHYMLKTQTKEENKFMKRILPHYYQYITENPHSLLVRILGMHRIKMYHIRRKVHFVIMTSVFDTPARINTIYDLKGSLVGREASTKERESGGVLKDLDLLNDNTKFHFGSKKHLFMLQLKKDTDFLAKLNIMDYSLLIGIHDRTSRTSQIANIQPQHISGGLSYSSSNHVTHHHSPSGSPTTATASLVYGNNVDNNDGNNDNYSSPSTHQHLQHSNTPFRRSLHHEIGHPIGNYVAYGGAPSPDKQYSDHHHIGSSSCDESGTEGQRLNRRASHTGISRRKSSRRQSSGHGRRSSHHAHLESTNHRQNSAGEGDTSDANDVSPQKSKSNNETISRTNTAEQNETSKKKVSLTLDTNGISIEMNDTGHPSSTASKNSGNSNDGMNTNVNSGESTMLSTPNNEVANNKGKGKLQLDDVGGDADDDMSDADEGVYEDESETDEEEDEYYDIDAGDSDADSLNESVAATAGSNATSTTTNTHHHIPLIPPTPHPHAKQTQMFHTTYKNDHNSSHNMMKNELSYHLPDAPTHIEKIENDGFKIQGNVGKLLKQIIREDSSTNAYNLISSKTAKASAVAPVYTFGPGMARRHPWTSRRDEGINSQNNDGKRGNEIYYLGIIDILQQYNAGKRAETVAKSFTHDSKEISSVNPKFYAQRFMEFMDKNID